MRGEGQKSRRSGENVSSRAIQWEKGQGQSPSGKGYKKIAILLEAVCARLLGEGDTPSSAESLLINSFLLLQQLCPL